MSKSAHRALLKAINTTGSQVQMAKLLGVTQAAVSHWARNGKLLPPQHTLKVEAATGVSRHELRPDIYPVEP